MEKISKIKAIHSCNGKDTDHGKVYYHDIELENGDRGSIGKKKENFFTVGQEIKYTISENTKYPGKFQIREVQENKGGKGGSYQQEDPQVKFIGFAMGYAKDIAVSRGGSTEHLFVDADDMYQWMTNKYEKIKSQPQQDNKTTEKNDTDIITPEQIKLVKTLRSKSGLSEDIIRAHLKRVYNVESTKDLTKTGASLFIDELKDPKIISGSKSKDDDLPF